MRTVYYSILALLATGLVACGGSSGDQAPIAANLSVEYDWAEDFEPIDVLSGSSAPSGGTLTLESVGDANYGTTAIEDDLVSYTPDDDFIGIDSFTYMISDGSQESEGTVEVEVVSTVAMEGRVVDSPIANATVTITIDGIAHQVEADDEGFYSLPLTIRSVESDEVIRIAARGSAANDQGHVTLSSMLVSAERLLERSNDAGKITRSEMNDVNVTHVTTARDVLTRRAAGDEVITQANVAEFGNTIDPQLMIQMAAVTKLVIDNPDFQLPAGYDNIEDFLNNEDSYNEFVEEASAGGDNSPLNQAIAETLDDPEVMPELRVEDLFGRYMRVSRAPSFMKPDANQTWEINEDGLVWYQDPESYGDRLTFSLNGNRLIMDKENAPLSKSEHDHSVSESDFEGRPEARDAWIAYNGWDEFYSTLVRREFEWGMNSGVVVSATDNELILRYNHFYNQVPVRFTYNDEEFEIFSSFRSESEVDVRLVKVSAFMQSDLVFDVEQQKTWLLPAVLYQSSHLDTVVYDFAEDGTYNMRQADVYLRDGNYDSNKWQDNHNHTSGTWRLSGDARHLTLTSDAGASVRLTRHRADAEYQSIVAEYLFDDKPLTTQLLYGLPFPEEVDFSPVEEVIASDQVFNSTVNSRSAILWGDDDVLRIQNFMFDFAENGTGQQLNGLCEGEQLITGNRCPEAMTLDPEHTVDITWAFEENGVFDKVFSVNRQINQTYPYQRFWIPLGFSERNIMSVLEWTLFNNERTFMTPRYNQYQYADRPEKYESTGFGALAIEAEPNFKDSNLGYIIVNPQRPMVSQSRH